MIQKLLILLTIGHLTLTAFSNQIDFSSNFFDQTKGPQLSDPIFLKYPQNENFLLSNGQSIKLPLHSTPVGFVLYGTAEIDQLNKVLIDQDLYPIQFLPGKGLIMVYSEDFKNATLRRYQEMTILIAVSDRKQNSPFLIGDLLNQFTISLQFSPFLQNQLIKYLPHTSFYVWKMFVTTELAQIVGREVWGYPKELAQIKFSESEIETQMHLVSHSQLCEMKWTAHTAFSRKIPVDASLYTSTPKKIKRTLRNILIKGESQFKLFDANDTFIADQQTECGQDLHFVDFKPFMWQKNSALTQIGKH